MNLRDCVIVITGGSTGIGRATAELLATRGANLVLAARRADRLSAAVEAVEALGAEAIGVPTDVTKLADVERLADAAYERFDRVDVAFFNAGSPGVDQLLDPDLEQWRAAVDLNIFGLLHGIKAFVPRMVADEGRGMVLATTSGAGIHGTAAVTPPYSATKNAQLSIVECLYAQVRDEGADLHVGIVVPPLTRTNLVGDDLSVWEMVEDGLRSSGSEATLVEPEEFAHVIAEGIEQERFWIEFDLEQDERLLGGRAAPMIEQTHRTVQAKATAMVEHLRPDTYLW